MDPAPRNKPAALSLPPRPINAPRHFSWSFDTPTSANHRPTYVSPDLTPSAASAFPASTPLLAHRSKTTPRLHTISGGYAAGGDLFTHSALQLGTTAPAASGFYGTPGSLGAHSSWDGHGPFGYAGHPNALQSSPPRGSLSEQDPFFAPALPPASSRRAERKDKKAKKVAVDKQQTFLAKLYGILRDPMYRDIISWDQTGQVLVISKPEELAEKVLLSVFRQTRFASFSRQLNIYGFMRKVSLKHVDGGNAHPDASTWSHDTLHRDSTTEDIIQTKRRVPPRKSQSAKRSTSDPASASESESDPNDAYQRHLLQDGSSRSSRRSRVPTLPQPLPFTSPRAGSEQLSPLSPRSPTEDLPFAMDLQTCDEKDEDEEHPSRMASYPSNRFLPFPGFTSASPHIRPSFPLASRPATAGAALAGATTETSAPGEPSPQTAPMWGSLDPEFQVWQSHNRTRSVQGEPPSAAWAPPSFHDAAPWSTGLDPFGGKRGDGNDNNASGLTGLHPAQAPLGQEGWLNMYTREPTSPPPNSLGMIGARLAGYPPTAGPASVPASFAPGLAGTLTLGEPFRFRMPSSVASPAPLHTGNHAHSHSFDHTHPHANPHPAPSGTVSPGIYQTGFTPPKNTSPKPISSPRANPMQITASTPASASASTSTSTTMTRHERRQSISSTPYSPRQRPIQSLSLAQLSMSPTLGRGPVRGLGGMSGPSGVGGAVGAGGGMFGSSASTAAGAMSDGYRSSIMCTPEMGLPGLPLEVGVVGLDDGLGMGLPTAGLQGMEDGLFSGALKEEREEEWEHGVSSAES